MRLSLLSLGLASDWHNPSARSLRGLLRALAARGHEVLAWEPAPNPFLSAELRACGAASWRAFAAEYGDLQRHTFPDLRGQELTLWLVRTLATAEVCLVDARLPTELVRKAGQLTSAGLRTLLYDATGAALANGAAWATAAAIAGYGLVLAGSAAGADRYRALGAPRVAVLAPSVDPLSLGSAAPPAPEVDIALLAEGTGDTAALLALAALARALPGRTCLLAGDGDGGDGEEAVRTAGVQREPACGRRAPATVYPRARLALHLPAGPHSASARPLEALACRVPVVALAAEAGDPFALVDAVTIAATAADLAATVEGLLDDEAARLALAARGQAAVLTAHTAAGRAAELEALVASHLPPVS